MKPNKHKKPKKLYLCFSCKQKKTGELIARHGTKPQRDSRGKRTFWHVCRECHTAWKAEREMDKQAYRAATGDIRVGEEGSEAMGWNGVPSEKSLRARRR